MADNLMTAKEVAEQLNIKPCSVYQLFHRGALPGVRIREMNALRFEPKDVTALKLKRQSKKN